MGNQNLKYRLARLETPEILYSILFLTYSRVFKLGWWTGNTYYDKDNVYDYEKHEIVMWIPTEELLPSNFDEEQKITGEL